MCEEVFGKALKRHKDLRSKIVIQTKCGIGKGMYDFFKDYILSALEGCFLGNEHFADLNKVIKEVAQEYGVTDIGIAIAWLLRLPDKMQPVVGSPKEIIKKVIRRKGVPANFLYPFVRLGAAVYGHFNLEETSPVEALRKCRVPVIFIHGEADNFDPCEMNRINYEVCAAPKMLLTIPKAGHSLGYLTDGDAYQRALQEFNKLLHL